MTDSDYKPINERLASPQQKRMFFALGHQLGYDAEKLKERAKAKYDLATFTDITTDQLTPLIDSLQDKIDKELIKCPNCRGTGHINKLDLVNDPIGGD